MKFAFHTADNATPPFVGVYPVEGSEAGEDIMQFDILGSVSEAEDKAIALIKSLSAWNA